MKADNGQKEFVVCTKRLLSFRVLLHTSQFVCRLTLRSFSWLSVIEILKAAETTIKPVRLGISKAQPRGIVSGIQSQGERPQTMQSLLGASK